MILSMASESQAQLPDRLLELAQKAALAMYFIVDHVGWAKQAAAGKR